MPIPAPLLYPAPDVFPSPFDDTGGGTPTPVPGTGGLPGLADVGALIRARTKDSGGNEVGTFTANTRPTDEQAILLIAEAQGDVTAQLGSIIPTELLPAAKTLVAIGTAMLIELGYFPEQVASGKSPYDQLERLYKMRMEAAVKALAEAGGADQPGLFPSYGGFPETAIGMEFPW